MSVIVNLETDPIPTQKDFLECYNFKPEIPMGLVICPNAIRVEFFLSKIQIWLAQYKKVILVKRFSEDMNKVPRVS